MKLKKLLSVVLAAALVLSMAACGSKEKTSAQVIDVDLTDEEYAFGVDRDQADLLEAVDYIERDLMNPQAADALLGEIDARLGALAEFAERHPMIDDPVLRAWELRPTRIGNYLAFYRIDGARVNVVRILYARRDWLSILRETAGQDSENSPQ